MKGCVGPTPCGLCGEGEFIRCERLGHSDPYAWRSKNVIVQGGTGVWFLYLPSSLEPIGRFRFSSFPDAIEATNVVAACG